MSLHSDITQQTIDYYDEHADEYVCGTIDVDMETFYRPFLKSLQKGQRILDAGCGSGRDTKAFMDRGFDVVPLDASKEMILATQRLTGLAGHQLRLQEVSFDNEFDGIWACASLLHIPLVKLRDVIDRLALALRRGGVFYMSFKEGQGERRDRGGRLFTDFTEDGLKHYLSGQTCLVVEQVWRTEDARPTRTDRWINVIARRE